VLASDLLSAADPVAFARSRLAFSPDPVQASVLRSRHPRRLLNCSRQWGKSTTTAVLAVHHLLYGSPGNLTLIVAPTLRQSSELLRKCSAFLRRLRLRSRRESGNPHSLLLTNGSRILALPGRADTIRCFSAVSLLILDEAARVSDDLYFSVRPMVAASGGSIVALSTPAGQRGFFYQASLDDSWERYVIPATECSRLPDAFLDEERRSICEWWYRQEYLCEFVPLSAGLFERRRLERLLIRDSVAL
jgi:hypothetical protein